MKILLIKTRAMGDAIMGLSAAQYLKEKFPHAHITYALPPWIVPLFDHVQSSVDRVLPINLDSARGISRFTQIIFDQKFDLFLEIHQSGKSQKYFSTLSCLTGIPYYFNNHQKTERAPSTQRDLDGVWRNLFPQENRPHYLEYVPQIKMKEASNDFILLGVVASRKTKMWPLENYLELINQLSQEQFVIPLSTSTMDLEIKAQLEKNLPLNAKLIQVPMSDLPKLCAQSKIYIGNDTGLKHLCVALGKKTFTFFGPEEPFEWHPYPVVDHPYFFIENLECRTREAHFCGLATCDSMICLNQISTKQVLERIQKYVS